MIGPHDIFLRLLFIAGLLALWEFAVHSLGVPAYLVPAPSAVFAAFSRGVGSGLYQEHIGVTLTETAFGFVTGSALALVLGTAIALSRRFDYYLSPIIIMFQAMPKVALAPLIMVWFGLGLTSKVVTVTLVCFFPLMINTIVGLRSAEEDRIDLMRSLAATPMQIFLMLRLPNALPFIFAGLEIAMIFSLIGAIVGEFVGATAGLGMLIESMNFSMDVAGQFSVLLILSVVGLALNHLVSLVRRRVIYWDAQAKSESGAARGRAQLKMQQEVV